MTQALDPTPATAPNGAMDPEEMRALLEELGWKQADLVRKLEEEGGHPVATTTVWGYLNGRSKVPPALAWGLRLAPRAKRRGGVRL